MATSKVLKPRRGSTAEHATFRGQAFEITFDTDKKTLVMHDGLTMGGFPLAHESSVAETDSALRTLIDQKVSEVESVAPSELQALDSALRGLINSQAQQQAAKDANQDDVVTVLDSTLRSLIANAQNKADSALAAAEEAASKAGLPLGFEYVRLTGQTPPFGGVDYLGQETTRAMYADLWAWLNEHKPDAIVSESEWQTLYAAQNGNVGKFSTGDGSTTFRFPRMVGYAKGAASAGEIGQYTKEGLPNITASWENGTRSWAETSLVTGAAYVADPSSTYFSNDATTTAPRKIGIDASRSSAIYGRSSHVTPETVTVVMGVIAFGAVAEIGTATEAGLVAEVAEIGGNVGALQNGVGRASAYIVETWSSGTSWYRKWSDGWIEQGGIASGTSNAWSTCTLNTAFANTNYTILITGIGQYTAPDIMAQVRSSSKTKTSFMFLRDDHSDAGVYWTACGY